MRCRYRGKRQRGVLCARCGLHIYEARLIDRRETVKLYLACVALYLVLIVYVGWLLGSRHEFPETKKHLH